MKVHAECVDECLVAASRGPQCACDKVCAYLDPKIGWCPRCQDKVPLIDDGETCSICKLVIPYPRNQ